MALLLGGCSVLTRIDGRVVDRTGHPIAGAKIWSAYREQLQDRPEVANSHGEFQFAIAHTQPGERLLLMLSAEGYQTELAVIETREQHIDAVFTMVAGSAANLMQAAPLISTHRASDAVATQCR
jgi:hypothetical protein